MNQSVPVPSGDSTRQKSVGETLLSLSIREAIPDALVPVNRQGVIIQANSQTEALFSYTRDQLIGQKIEILVPERPLDVADHAQNDRSVGGDDRAEAESRPEIPTHRAAARRDRAPVPLAEFWAWREIAPDDGRAPGVRPMISCAP